MTNEECMGRLMASATHDLRNALAVIRECSGLTEDMLKLHSPDSPIRKRMLEALAQVQGQVRRGATLAESMGYLAACASGGEGESSPVRCDLNRVVQDFCTMILRRGKACALEAKACPTSEPVIVTAKACALFSDLLEIFDACAAVGGGAHLGLSPLSGPVFGPNSEQNGAHAIAISVSPEGPNVDMVLAALTSCPLLQPARKGWLERLVPGYNPQERRFILPVGAA